MTEPPIPTTEAVPSPSGDANQDVQQRAADVQLEGKTEIDDKLVFEVEIPAHVAASHVAADIVDRVERALPDKPCRVLFLDDQLASALALHRAFVVQCEALHGAFESARKGAQQGSDAIQPAPTVEVADASLDEAGLEFAVAGPITAVTASLSAAVNVLGFFRVDTSYYGRAAKVSERALVMELARQLLKKTRIGFRWPSLGVAPISAGSTASSTQFLDKLNSVSVSADAAQSAIHKLAVEVQTLKDDDPDLPASRLALDNAHEAYESAAAIFEQLRENFLSRGDNERQSPAYLLQLAEDTLSAQTGPDEEPTYYLTASVETAGGSYRIRRHLWQMLSGKDPLTVSGGVVVSFALLDKRGDFLAAATLPHREPFENLSHGSHSSHEAYR